MNIQNFKQKVYDLTEDTFWEDSVVTVGYPKFDDNGNLVNDLKNGIYQEFVFKNGTKFRCFILCSDHDNLILNQTKD